MQSIKRRKKSNRSVPWESIFSLFYFGGAKIRIFNDFILNKVHPDSHIEMTQQPDVNVATIVNIFLFAFNLFIHLEVFKFYSPPSSLSLVCVLYVCAHKCTSAHECPHAMQVEVRGQLWKSGLSFHCNMASNSSGLRDKHHLLIQLTSTWCVLQSTCLTGCCDTVCN